MNLLSTPSSTARQPQALRAPALRVRALRARAGLVLAAAASSVLVVSCSSDDSDSTPPPVPNTSTAFTASLDRAQTTNNATVGAAVRVTVRNEAPILGTYQTPVWIGLHDGTFDLFDDGVAASASLERLAEDGDTAFVMADFDGASGTYDQALITGTFGPVDGPFPPREVASTTFRVDPAAPESRFLSFASMVIPSNDAFVANDDPMAHRIFSDVGDFVGAGFTIAGTGVLDAGTEVNDEMTSSTAFFGQSTANTGADENASIGSHVGYQLAGPILSDPMFAGADFARASGYNVLSVEIDDVSSSIAEPTGSAIATLDEPNLMLTFSLSVANLSGPATLLHLHRGDVGVAGAVEVDLMPFIDVNEGGLTTASGTVAITASQLQAMRDGNLYFNLHTAMNPAGEVRGQVRANNAATAPLTTAANVATPILGETVRFTVQNAAPAMGTFQTPVWLGFHDGTFDMFDVGAMASADLEVLAEDGDAGPLGTALATAVTGSFATTLMGAAGPIAPGELVTWSRRFDPNDAATRYLSWATMILPSNDAFLANDGPTDHELFNLAIFSGTDFTVAAGDALDAGTEMNDEDELNVPFLGAATTPGAGTVTMDNITGHPGYMTNGPILMDPMFANADFATTTGYEFLRVAISSETPTIPASGVVSIRLSGTTATIDASAFHLSGSATAIELRDAAAGAVGPVVQDLTGDVDVNSNGTMQITTTFQTDQTFRDALSAGTIYFQVRTALNPAGELRGQVTVAPPRS
ncbi:CHRD domain protein [Planctomycetes bacterium Poly30]|uniref:CHRD domain protein n=1 Tax=Saltatorellus ferox TaxID=2528018 RepID=A0A518EPH5_9BACT|nr:CHRD domain protein [Planctomycetes bacterium Poly30]